MYANAHIHACLLLSVPIFWGWQTINLMISLMWHIRTHSISLLLQIKEANEDLPEDEDTVADSAFQSHAIGKNSHLYMSLAKILSTCSLISVRVSSQWPCLMPTSTKTGSSLLTCAYLYLLIHWKLPSNKNIKSKTYEENIGVCQGMQYKLIRSHCLLIQNENDTEDK